VIFSPAIFAILLVILKILSVICYNVQLFCYNALLFLSHSYGLLSHSSGLLDKSLLGFCLVIPRVGSVILVVFNLQSNSLLLIDGVCARQGE
jgi:hypothetical protein